MIKSIHDVAEVPFNQEEIIVVATDNSGSIGMKTLDAVNVRYETVSYYAFRVAYMECVAAGGEPFSIILHNFNDSAVWHELIKGINKGLKEVGLDNIPITGSTETNFQLDQSALGLVVLGKKSAKQVEKSKGKSLEMAIIGKPLVGQAVIDHPSEIAPLALYHEFAHLTDVYLIRPISSKGIKYEVERQIEKAIHYPAELAITESGGPGTSFLIVYDSKMNALIKNKADRHLQMIASLK